MASETSKQVVKFRWPSEPGEVFSTTVEKSMLGKRVKYEGSPAVVVGAEVVDDGRAMFVTLEVEGDKP